MSTTAQGDLERQLRLAQACCLSGRAEQAMSLYRHVLALRPGQPEATHYLAALLLGAGAIADARAVLQDAIACSPGAAWPRHHLAQLLRALGDDHAAVAAYREAISLQPELVAPHLDLAELALTLGDLATGFSELEWRFHTGGETPRRAGFDAPVWDGSPLAGQTVMVWIEQGLGDHLQFARYAREITARGGRVWLQTPEPLARLYAASLDGVERLVIGDEEPGAFDFQIPLMSLPRIFGTTLETIPGREPYLAPPAGDRCAARDLLAACERTRAERPLRIGVVWASLQSHPAAVRRDVALQALLPFARRSGTAVYALQFGERAADARGCAEIADLSESLGDFARTAALALEMDVVLTVDTAMAHLGGAIGQRTWVLLGEGSDWRWLRAGEGSPWYPSLHLFRQHRSGDWGEVLERVGAALDVLEREVTQR